MSVDNLCYSLAKFGAQKAAVNRKYESVQVFRRLSFLGERMESWKSNEAPERGIRLS